MENLNSFKKSLSFSAVSADSSDEVNKSEEDINSENVAENKNFSSHKRSMTEPIIKRNGYLTTKEKKEEDNPDGKEDNSVSASVSSPSAVENTGSEPNKSAPKQWYLRDEKLINTVTGEPFPFTGKELYENEVKSMKSKFPQAGLHKLPNGDLCWLLPMTIDTGKRKEDWTFMLKYDSIHPNSRDNGGSCKVILIKPTYEELNARAMKCRGRNAPHLMTIPECYEYKCISTTTLESAREYMLRGYSQGAVQIAAEAVRYAYMFLIGLDNEEIWKQL